MWKQRSILVFAILAAGLLFSSVASGQTSRLPLGGPSGGCQFWSPNSNSVGQVRLSAKTSAEPTHPVRIGLRAQLPTDRTYTVYLSIQTMQDGKSIGCSNDSVGSINTGSSGRVRFGGTIALRPGSYTVQVIVSELITSGNYGYNTAPTLLLVP